MNNIEKGFLKILLSKRFTAINLLNEADNFIIGAPAFPCFLGFGLVLDLLKIDITANFFIDINLFNEKRSVFGTLQSLLESANYLPFLLIFLFGILVPLLKSGIIFYMLLAKNVASKWQNAVSIISKWAMADVFAISIFIAFLGARAIKNTTASLEPGFYYFTAYVLMSAVIVSFLTGETKIATLSNV